MNDYTDFFARVALLVMAVGVPVFLLWAASDGKNGKHSKSKSRIGYVQPNGRVSWQGKQISLAEANRRGLRLGYASQPVKRKRHFFKAWD